ncbi:uncharacterized protein LOC100571964 [Acyrthosiphon pisum]|uniref:Uncharacterized protein n=1 Tax=Acyrthosiphon pisum TaxID=7029 RepID=A0A8R2ABC1_ACYPI|nr:uncharacterized protein LOC100571964 [Acyrthosiphon pisum]|eukprot:XP_003245827.1 PREDICTED: uncharacterized protein LOC100571964 [Acyrthosiphon pisum]
MFQFKIILLITCLEVYCGFAYQCPKSVPYSTIPKLSRVSLPVSNALAHFKIENEFLIDSNGRTRYVCVEITPEIYALRNKTINNDNDIHVQTGEDYKEHIIPHSLGGSNHSLNVFSLNQNCKSKLLNSSVEQQLDELLTEHSRITYVAELEYTYNVTDVRPTRINVMYMDENEKILGSVRMINSPPNTTCETIDLKMHTKSKRSFELFASPTNSTHPAGNSTHPESSTKPINCMAGCRRTECWAKVEDRDKKCRCHFHSVHANSLCIGEWCYCCSYY